MKRKIITIENDSVRIPTSGEIWMSQHEIALLFECFVAKVSANIRSILKSGLLWQPDVCQTYYYENSNSVELYNLEMITALAFRIKSKNAEIFRNYLIKKAVTNTGESVLRVVNWNNCGFSSN